MNIEHYTPSTLREIASRVRRLRLDLLKDLDDAGADAESESHYLLGMAALETAFQHFVLASYKQSQAIR
jgi:hypothetical protein